MQDTWWTIKYLETGRELCSGQVAFGLLPEVRVVDIENGHIFGSDQIEIISGPVTLDLRTGTIWVNNQVAERIPDYQRVVLHKRKYRSSSGEQPYDHVHMGLLNQNGEGVLARITQNGDVFLEPHVVSVGV